MSPKKYNIDNQYTDGIFTDIPDFSGEIFLYSSSLIVRDIIPYLIIWVKLNKIPYDSFNFCVLPKTPVISMYDSTLKIIFYDKKNLDSFNEYFKDRTDILPEIPSGKYEKLSIVNFPIANIDYNSDVRSITSKEIDLIIWLYNNCSGNFYRNGTMFIFDNNDDAIKFKLTWNKEDFT